MTTKYAAQTKVPVEKSRTDIERVLERFNATAMLWMRDDEIGAVTVAFKKDGRSYKFTLYQPDPESFRVNKGLPGHYARRLRTDNQVQQMSEQEWRRLFRSLYNYVKATLDAVDSGIIPFETAMLPYLILPDGQTVAQQAERQLAGLGTVDLSRALMAGDSSQNHIQSGRDD